MSKPRPESQPSLRVTRRRSRGPADLLAALVLLAVVLPAAAEVPARPAPVDAASDAAQDAARQLVHVLDYLGRDYAGSVRGGQVIDEGEYREQTELSEEAARLAGEIAAVRADADLLARVRQVPELIARRADGTELAALCAEASSAVVRATGLPTAPRQWPDLAKGAALFETTCASCHGEHGAGNGPGSAALSPPPANLRDPARMDGLAPFSVFNTIRLGIEGTAMAGHPELSDEQAWDVAFHVLSLRYDGRSVATDALADVPPEMATLQSVALSSDDALREELAAHGLSAGDAGAASAALRTGHREASAQGLAVARARLGRVRTLVAAGDLDGAGRAALSAYLDGVEPVEPTLKVTSPALVTEIEGRMAMLREALRDRRGDAAIAAALHDCDDVIARAEASLGSGDLSPSAVLVGAATILLREGLEAALILVILLGIVRAWRAPRLTRQVHLGWIVALAAGFATWLVSEKVLAIPSAHREQLEGFTNLVAVVVLLYVGFWVHRATQGTAWKRMVNEKAREYVEGGRGLGLFALAFLAVYREAFETILFYRALWLEGGAKGSVALGAGFLAGLAALLLICLALFRFEAKLPLKQVFTGSAAVLCLLAFILSGKGMHSLQESGTVGLHLVPGMFRFDWLGLYPTYETLGAQVLTILVIAVLWWWERRADRRRTKSLNRQREPADVRRSEAAVGAARAVDPAG